MQRIGHFEFGLDRRPINVGDGAMGEILRAFHDGEEVRGWALYWASLHNNLADRLAADVALQDAVQAVRLEELCPRPQETAAQLSTHFHLPARQSLIPGASCRARCPPHYTTRTSTAPIATI